MYLPVYLGGGGGQLYNNTPVGGLYNSPDRGGSRILEGGAWGLSGKLAVDLSLREIIHRRCAPFYRGSGVICCH